MERNGHVPLLKYSRYILCKIPPPEWDGMEYNSSLLKHGLCIIPYFAVHNVHSHFLSQTFRKKILCFNFLFNFYLLISIYIYIIFILFNFYLFIIYLFYLFIYIYSCFCIIKEFQHLFWNIWYKKFYVMNNYKTQEQIQGISGTTDV